jgi:two-component sensor histidine kinase
MSTAGCGDVYRLAVEDNGTAASDASREHKSGMGSRLMQLLAGELGSSVETTASPAGTSVVVDIIVKNAQRS